MRAGYGAAPQLLEENASVGERAALAAIFLGNEDAQPAGRGQLAPRFQGSSLVGRCDLQQSFLGVFLGYEAASGRLQHFLFRGEGQVHFKPLDFR